MLYDIEMRKVAFTAQPIEYLSPSPHIHTHVELIYITKGQSVVTLDNKQYTLNSGDILLSFPNQIHFYQDQSPLEGYLIIFTPETLQEFEKIFKACIPSVPVWNVSTLSIDVENYIKHIIHHLSQNTTLSLITAKGYLLSLIGEMFLSTAFIDKPGEYDTVKKLLHYCTENYTKPLTLDYLSKELYLSKYYISHVFKERMNISYKDFITELRVNHACKLLRENVSVTDTAYASGFTSIKTFNRVFLKYMKMPPRNYAKSNKTQAKKDATH